MRRSCKTLFKNEWTFKLSLKSRNKLATMYLPSQIYLGKPYEQVILKFNSLSKIHLVQLNEYETAPYFLQLSQNMTSDCLFNFVFSSNLPELHRKLFYFDVQNNFRHKTGKFRLELGKTKK